MPAPMTIWFPRPSSSYFPLEHIFFCHIFVFSQLRKHENTGSGGLHKLVTIYPLGHTGRATQGSTILDLLKKRPAFASI
ncbi:MAG: hypothetical protein A3F90_19375 [Deltaproteobacteria bacterium RIFCSPLOWO2_12_FULL_60_19]|nr:MAG: hypothetical protein A3F90_19375 [Deltaproteobacteria bacterium RIFCSPLOWO2_12_FULL_60_19]